MHSFSKEYIQKLLLHPSTAWLLSQCAEAKGMQTLWQRVRPDVLKKLKESAIVQSTESSNRIEGVEVARNRLLPLVLGRAKPKDRPEEEIIGYRKALSLVHRQHHSLPVSPQTVQRLHGLAQGGMVSDAGKWKTKDNDIIEFLPNGERQIRFHCLSAKRTPKATKQLCLGYQDVTSNNQLPDLIAISHLVFDFLCIHPFRDGNGRVSRLLTLLLIYQHGYDVGQFISLERIIENTKEDYYRVLGESSVGWHEKCHTLLPWTNYFLGVIRSAYQELKDRVERTTTGDTDSALVRETALSTDGEFAVADILKLHPTINRELIKKVLYGLKAKKKLKLLGKGRGAKWHR